MAAVTVIVDPDPAGHHLQAVANVARVAAETGRVVLLTLQGVEEWPSYGAYLGDLDFPLEVREVFPDRVMGSQAMIDAVADLRTELARTGGTVSTVVLMDADQALKDWFWRGRRNRRRLFGPRVAGRVVLMLTRYPARARLTDPWLYKLKLPKALLTALALLTGAAQRVVGFAGRDDLSAGALVKRLRDPDVCEAHSRDRVALRERHGLPVDRQIVGVFGVISERRNVPLIWESMQAAGVDADLLLAGAQDDDVRAWVEATAAANPGKVHIFDAFLPNQLIDELVAASDVAPIALTNNGPSGIMGKAIAAGVPVVTAGSVVRAAEVKAAGCGLAAELTPASLGGAIKQVLASEGTRESRIPPATPEEFARNLLGVDAQGRVSSTPFRA